MENPCSSSLYGPLKLNEKEPPMEPEE
jgi:hypothetical protein